VPVRNPRELAKAVNRILGDNQLAEKFGRASLSRAKQEHSLVNMVSKTAALYNNRLHTRIKSGILNCPVNS